MPQLTGRSESILPLSGIPDDRLTLITKGLMRIAAEVLDEEGRLRQTDVATFTWSIRSGQRTPVPLPSNSSAGPSAGQY